MSRPTPSPPTWDCHAHVLGPPERYPLWSGRDYDPPVATLEDYLALLDRHGVAHGVLVQPSVYRFDHRCLLDALDRAEGRLSGIAVPDPSATPRELERLHEHGVRGVRCNVLNAGGLGFDDVRAWTPVLRDLGWHVELHAYVDDLPDLDALVGSFGVPVVVDHMGRPRLPGGGDPSPAFARLVETVRTGRCFVKLSAPYRLSAAPPPWPDVDPLARALLDANPGRCVWGTDWPHVSTRPAVETADLVEALGTWCPDPPLRRVVLGDAPRALYGTS